MLASTSAFALMGSTMARAAIDPAAQPGETNWLHYANDLSSTRYSPLDQINAANFNKLELAWRFCTNALGPRLDADYQSTPLVVNGRLYCHRRLPPRCGLPGCRHRRTAVDAHP